ncbi:MAG: hypothetical protein D3925_06535 [Candidatus Electrothrix sp. AR5]|nr:hypothetical protein [Candidatus Electrothrix sp. AR5]
MACLCAVSGVISVIGLSLYGSIRCLSTVHPEKIHADATPNSSILRLRLKEIGGVYIFFFVIGVKLLCLRLLFVNLPCCPLLPAVFLVRNAKEKAGLLLLIPEVEDWYHVGKLSENGSLYNSFFTRHRKKRSHPVLEPELGPIWSAH